MAPYGESGSHHHLSTPAHQQEKEGVQDKASFQKITTSKLHTCLQPASHWSKHVHVVTPSWQKGWEKQAMEGSHVSRYSSRGSVIIDPGKKLAFLHTPTVEELSKLL